MKNFLFPLAVFLLVFTNACAPEAFAKKELSKEKFASEVLLVLQESYPKVPFEYDGETDTISPKDDYSGEHQIQIFLGNLYNRTFDLTPKERRAILDDFLKSSQDDEISTETLLENLFIRARTPSELSLRELLLLQRAGKPAANATRQKGELLFELVKDDPNAVVVVSAEMLDEHKLGQSEAMKIAQANLLNATPRGKNNQWKKADKDIWVSALEDDYDSVRLIALHEDLDLPFSGDLIAFMPSHSTCLITQTTNAETIKRMVELGYELSERHRPLSQKLWQLKDGGWKPWLGRDKESRLIADGQILQDALMSYAEQTDILEQIYIEKNEDVYVAKFTAYENQQGDVQTSAVFIGGSTLLPKTDRVSIIDDSQAEDDMFIGMLEWKAFALIIGKENLKIMPDLIPTRYDFIDPLDKAVMDKLIEAARNNSLEK